MIHVEAITKAHFVVRKDHFDWKNSAAAASKSAGSLGRGSWRGYAPIGERRPVRSAANPGKYAKVHAAKWTA